MAKKLKQRTKSKEIYYYKPVIQKYDKESNGFRIVSESIEDIKKIFSEIEKMSLDKNDKNSVYIKRDTNTYNYIVVDFKNNNYIFGRLISSSNDVYPSIDQDGNIIPLKDKLPPNSNLAHITHFVFFLDENIVGIEYNNVGARPTSLANYIITKFEGRYRLELVEAVNSTALKKLEKTHRIKELEIELDTRTIIEEQVQEGDLFSALNATQKIAQDRYSDDKLTIAIKIKSKHGFVVTDVIKESLKKLGLSRKIDDEHKKRGEKIKIKSQSQENETFNFDLVRQVIKAPKIQVNVNQNNMIDSDDMFEKIISNYEKFR